MILSLEWGSWNPLKALQSICPLGTCQPGGGCVIGELLDHTPRSPAGEPPPRRSAQTFHFPAIHIQACMCPAQGPGGSAETLYCTSSSGKTPGFLCLSGVNRAAHCLHSVFVLKKPSHNSLSYIRLRNIKVWCDFVPVLQTLSSLRQVTKQTMGFGGLQRGSVALRIWPLKLPGKFASR